ncbi:UNVERIFIED_CONTAM: Retrovirus-related Pol polyprotein from transposon TNT 1-94 [Sesamum calycinum]|uniref:Retrovirus-related Pol polyprotein from transposon TNT 1-94 n=1 Tax=Sesamum calycinum TaxID=2727403 RepID=A0AAW2L874_9LAMI
MDAYDIIIQLKAMFGNKLATDIILYTLHKGYANFVVNYHMNNLDKTVHELLGMLKTAEKSIKSEPKKKVLMVQKKKNAFKRGGNKNKKKASRKQGTGETVARFVKPKNGPSLDQKCFYYNQGGHWKRNCPKYLKDLKTTLLLQTHGLRRTRKLWKREHKSEVFEKIKEFQNEVQNQLGKMIKALQSDRGGEYLSQEFIDHLKSCGILEQRTPAGTLQLNGISECRNKTLLEMLEPRSEKVFFVGYPKKTKGYYFYNQSENKVFVARDGVFLGNQLLFKKQNGRNIHLEKVQEDQSKNTSEVITSPMGAQDVVSTSVGHTTDVVEPIRNMDEPTTYKAAMACADSEKWLIAMKFEMESMYENKVWNLVDLRKVAILKFIKILLAIASYFDYEIWQMDVKTTFLNGYLEDEVYMTQLEGFVDPRSPKKLKLGNEVVWIKNFISELGVVPSVASPIELYCDNNGAIAQTKEPTPNQKSKHVERKFHLIRNIIDRKDIKVYKITTDDNLLIR